MFVSMQTLSVSTDSHRARRDSLSPSGIGGGGAGTNLAMIVTPSPHPSPLGRGSRPQSRPGHASSDLATSQSNLIPLSLNAFSHRTASRRKKTSSSSGVLDTALMPDFSSLSAVAGSA